MTHLAFVGSARVIRVEPQGIIFTSQVIALLPLYNALTTYEAQTGEMQINRLDQPP